MSADQFVSYVSQIPFVLIFFATLSRAIQKPRRTTIDIALLFGAFALIVVLSWITAATDTSENSVVNDVVVVLLCSLPYLLLRVVADFIEVRTWLLRISEASLAFIVVATFVLGPELPGWFVLAIGIYFVGLGIYASLAFFNGARRSRGVTSRRLYAAATGSATLGLLILIAVIVSLFPSVDSLATHIITQAMSVAAGLGYYLAFSPPRLLRHAWQEPELRELLARVAVLPRLPNTQQIVRELEEGAAATGAPQAAIALWDAESGLLRFSRDGVSVDLEPGSWIAGRAFSWQQPIFAENAPRDDPEHAAEYVSWGARAILSAPITAGERRLGVLSVYAPRPPIFADEDLQLVKLLADQAAVILESRALIDEATRVQAREEATRLRDEFLIAAAHDLRTPLTAVITRAQFIERKAVRNPDVPISLDEIRLILNDLRRLNAQITRLLDAARAEHGRLLGAREPVDLVAPVEETRARHDWQRHQFVLEANGPVVGEYDGTRIIQVIDNLVENAIKYSPEGGEVRVCVEKLDGEAHLTVSDTGVGIPPADLSHVFERFHRGGNVENSRFAGMGLGLYICRGIVEQHGGRIAVRSVVGRGTTFDINLPLSRSSR